MVKGSKKIHYFGQQIKLNHKIWYEFQSNLVKTCQFFGYEFLDDSADMCTGKFLLMLILTLCFTIIFQFCQILLRCLKIFCGCFPQ